MWVGEFLLLAIAGLVWIWYMEGEEQYSYKKQDVQSQKNEKEHLYWIKLDE